MQLALCHVSARSARPCTLPLAKGNDGDFTVEEASVVLSQLHRGSRTLRGCYAALKCSHAGGRRLSLACANLTLRAGLFPSACSIREFNHIRKSGPTVVNSLTRLRAISISSDMMVFIDALLLQRCRASLESSWGPGQRGGISEALAMVLALVLL